MEHSLRLCQALRQVHTLSGWFTQRGINVHACHPSDVSQSCAPTDDDVLTSRTPVSVATGIHTTWWPDGQKPCAQCHLCCRPCFHGCYGRLSTQSVMTPTAFDWRLHNLSYHQCSRDQCSRESQARQRGGHRRRGAGSAARTLCNHIRHSAAVQGTTHLVGLLRASTASICCGCSLDSACALRLHARPARPLVSARGVLAP